jgi:hypothetical protein
LLDPFETHTHTHVKQALANTLRERPLKKKGGGKGFFFLSPQKRERDPSKKRGGGKKATYAGNLHAKQFRGRVA